ncbi:DNAse I-like superfamily protein [Forsythia ovata]|uniref:DNAse I-like superfamily protein n=1 Tax=Forsythia ovata TaxID=205694 RepID=A0ABD1UTD9_9LAMI
MVGIFLSIWARGELVKDIGHLKISCMGRGIMGCLGNKGCISISLTFHQTSFCFMCCHLASGEKEGDELRRNYDVAEILKGTRFSRVCKNSNRRIPERILDHDRIIWLGDLNYRVALSYEDTKLLLDEHDWDSLLDKDQLNMEREAGRVFKGWNEGKIAFAPTYKYSHNSDSYVGETANSKKERRTPSWY